MIRRLRTKAGGSIRMLGDAAASLLLRPGHTIGMIAGIMLGVASVVGIVAIADTQQVQVDRRFDLQRSDQVVVRALTPSKAGFDPQRVADVASLTPVASVGEFSVWSAAETVFRKETSRGTRPIVVADAAGVNATGTRVVAGAPLDTPTFGSGPVAWVGEALAGDLGITSKTDLEEIRIVVRETSLQVVGIVANDNAFGYASYAVLIPRPTAVDVLGGDGENIRVVAKVRPGSASAVGDYMVASLDPYREFTLDDVTPPDGKILLTNVGSDLRRIGAVLGVFMGLISMITVANTLMMAVHQRRSELGLRCAIGWRRRQVGALILAESTIAGSLASVLGVGLGLGAAATWSRLEGWELVLAPWLPFAAIAAGLTASLVGGLIPAYLAASTPPITAMRS